MSLTIRLSLLAGVLFYAFFVYYFLKKENLSLKYSLLWIFFIIVMLIMIAFPQLVEFVGQIIGIKTPVNTVFVMVTFFILLILLSLTSIISRQTMRIRKLAQTIAIMEEQLRKLEKSKYM